MVYRPMVNLLYQLMMRYGTIWDYALIFVNLEAFLMGRYFFLMELYVLKELCLSKEIYMMVVLFNFGFLGMIEMGRLYILEETYAMVVLFNMGRQWIIEGIRLCVLEEVYVMMVCLNLLSFHQGADMGRLYFLKELYVLAELSYLSQLTVALTNLEVEWSSMDRWRGPGSRRRELVVKGPNLRLLRLQVWDYIREKVYMGDSRLALPSKVQLGL